MSRTYKDRPYQVKVRDRRVPTVERHWHEGSYWQRLRGAATPGCDLAEFDAATDRTARVWFNCVRHLAHEYYRTYHRGGRAPGWFVHHIWNGPERVRVRDGLRVAAAEYRAAVTGGHQAEWDFDFPCHQHRHGGHWLYD